MEQKDKEIDLGIKEMYESRFSAEHLVSDVDKDLLFCPICKSIITMPTEISNCGHLFCNFCIVTSMANENSKCPICKKGINTLQISLSLERFIISQKVKCCNQDCNKIFLVGEIQKHLEKECLLESEKCKYCDEYIIRKDMEEHKEACGKRLITCPLCQLSHEIREKHIDVCPDVIIPCKYNHDINCDYVKARKDMKEHEEDTKFHLELVLANKNKKKTLVGTYIDVRDCNPYPTAYWEPSYVSDQKENKIKVRYLRWEEKWSEWLDIDTQKDRLAPFGTKKYQLRNEFYNKHMFEKFMESLQPGAQQV